MSRIVIIEANLIPEPLTHAYLFALSIKVNTYILTMKCQLSMILSRDLKKQNTELDRSGAKLLQKS